MRKNYAYAGERRQTSSRLAPELTGEVGGERRQRRAVAAVTVNDEDLLEAGANDGLTQIG